MCWNEWKINFSDFCVIYFFSYGQMVRNSLIFFFRPEDAQCSETDLCIGGGYLTNDHVLLVKFLHHLVEQKQYAWDNSAIFSFWDMIDFVLNNSSELGTNQWPPETLTSDTR